MKSKTDKRGFTLVEMMISIAILAIIFIPLVKIMTASLQNWWGTRAKLTIESDGREAMDYMSREFQGAYRFSMGNLLYNAGFEGNYMDADGKNQPYLWSSIHGDNRYNRTGSTNTVASGYASITLAAGSPYWYQGAAGSGFDIEKDNTEVLFVFRAKSATAAVVNVDVTGDIRKGQTGSPEISTGTATSVYLSPTVWKRYAAIGTLDAGTGYIPYFESGSGYAIIDEVSVIPLDSVLLDVASTTASGVNAGKYMYVSQTAGGAPGEPESLFKIDTRKIKGGGTMYRLNCYSVEYSESGAASGVRTRFYNALAENLRKLEFKIEDPGGGGSADQNILAAHGVVPVTIVLQMGTRVIGRSADDPTKFTLRTTIYPRK